MSNNPLQREYFPGVEEVNEEAARQVAGEAGERALSLRPQSPVPDLDPAAADVQMGGMDNDDMPAQGRGNPQPRGQNRRRGPGDRRTPRTQAYWNRGRQEGHRGPYGGHRGIPTQIFNNPRQVLNIRVANTADAARLVQQLGGSRPNHPHRGRRDQRRGARGWARRGDRGRGQQ